LQRFFVPPELLIGERIKLTDKELLHQLTRVLRARVGDRCLLLPGDGTQHLATIAGISPQAIEVLLAPAEPAPARSGAAITLAQAIPSKPAVFEEILQHGTELGVAHFVPLITARTQVHSLRNLPRLGKILREAAEQSEQSTLPTLAEPLRLTELLARATHGITIIGDSFGTPPLLASLLPELHAAEAITVIIGPEGGFTTEEIAAATAAGVPPYSLGRQILRTETAGLATISAIRFSTK
jgi:16S rRNA (uracil1498-N3)-methyltransferase